MFVTLNARGVELSFAIAPLVIRRQGQRVSTSNSGTGGSNGPCHPLGHTSRLKLPPQREIVPSGAWPPIKWSQRPKKVRLFREIIDLTGISDDELYYSGIPDGFEDEFGRLCFDLSLDVGANIGVTSAILSQVLQVPLRRLSACAS